MPQLYFKNPEWADEYGLVGVGGDLWPATLIRAYRAGIFPWYDAGDPILWWSPDPRAIFELDGFHVPRRLQRTLRSARFAVTYDRDFTGVIHGCAENRTDGTWITAEMIAAYVAMHHLGHAHSVEVWCEGELAGGVYGVTVGALFAGESMFTRVRDASKVALTHLVGRLRERGFQLFDIQFLTDHTRRLGAVEISRTEYLRRLRAAVSMDAHFC